MTKSELVAKLATQLGEPKAQVRRTVDTLVETITAALVKGERIQISGLGTFEIRFKKARPGRNPKTGAPMQIDARNSVGFRPAKPLKEAVR